MTQYEILKALHPGIVSGFLFCMAKAKRTTNKPKRKVQSRYGFMKDVFHNKKQDVVDWVNQPGVDVRCIEHGYYDDGTEFMNIVIEGFKA